MPVEQNTEELLKAVADEYAKAFFSRSERLFKHLNESHARTPDKKTDTPSAVESQHTITKLQQTNVRLTEIRDLLKTITKAFNGMTVPSRTDQFPHAISEPLKALVKRFSVSSTNNNNNTVKTSNEKNPTDPQSLLPKTDQPVLPVSIEQFSDHSLENLGNKLNNILPKAIKDGMKGVIESMQEMFGDLADVVEDSSYQPGILDYLTGGGRGGKPGRPRRGRSGRSRARTRPPRLPKGTRLSGLGKGMGVLGLIAAPVLAGMEYGERKEEGQTSQQAVTGTAASTVGGFAGSMAGGAAGAKLGGMIGLVGGPAGAAAGAIIGGGIGMIGGGILGSMAGGSIADKVTGVGAKNPSEKPLTPEEKEQHDKLIKYVSSLGKYASVQEFLDAVDKNKEGRIRWNKNTKQWEPRLPEPKHKNVAPPTIVTTPVKKAAEEANKPDATSSNGSKQKPRNRAEAAALRDSASKAKPVAFNVDKNLPLNDKKSAELDPGIENWLKSSESDEFIKRSNKFWEERKAQKTEEKKKLEEEFNILTKQLEEEKLAQTSFMKLDHSDKQEVEKYKIRDKRISELRKKIIPIENSLEKINKFLEKTESVKPVQDGLFNNKGLLISAPEGQGGSKMYQTLSKDITMSATPDGWKGFLDEAFKNSTESQNNNNKGLLDETKITNKKLDGLSQSMQLMAKALSKFGENLPSGTTVINAGAGVQQQQSQSAGIAQYVSDMKSAARMYGAYIQEPYAF